MSFLLNLLGFQNKPQKFKDEPKDPFASQKQFLENLDAEKNVAPLPLINKLANKSITFAVDVALKIAGSPRQLQDLNEVEKSRSDILKENIREVVQTIKAKKRNDELTRREAAHKAAVMAQQRVYKAIVLAEAAAKIAARDAKIQQEIVRKRTEAHEAAVLESQLAAAAAAAKSAAEEERRQEAEKASEAEREFSEKLRKEQEERDRAVAKLQADARSLQAKATALAIQEASDRAEEAAKLLAQRAAAEENARRAQEAQAAANLEAEAARNQLLADKARQEAEQRDAIARDQRAADLAVQRAQLEQRHALEMIAANQTMHPSSAAVPDAPRVLSKLEKIERLRGALNGAQRGSPEFEGKGLRGTIGGGEDE